MGVSRFQGGTQEDPGSVWTPGIEGDFHVLIEPCVLILLCYGQAIMKTKLSVLILQVIGYLKFRERQVSPLLEIRTARARETLHSHTTFQDCVRIVTSSSSSEVHYIVLFIHIIFSGCWGGHAGHILL